MSEEGTMDGGSNEQSTPQGAETFAPAQNAAGTDAGTGGSLLSGTTQTVPPAQNEGDGKGGVQPAQAPEKYTLQIPDDIYTPEQVAVAEKQFRELGLDNAAAQKLMDISVANQQQVREQHQAQVNKWAEEVRMDKEMGGPALTATVMEAKSALGKFDGDGKVFGMLEQTGYSNHPEVIRFLSRIGKALGEDGVVTGKETSDVPPLEERLYPDMKNKR